MNLKLALGALALTTAALMATPGIASAQTEQDSTDLKTHTATGCLQKSPVTNT